MNMTASQVDFDEPYKDNSGNTFLPLNVDTSTILAIPAIPAIFNSNSLKFSRENWSSKL